MLDHSPNFFENLSSWQAFEGHNIPETRVPNFFARSFPAPSHVFKAFFFTVGYAYGSWSHSKSMSVQRLRGRQVLRSVLKNKRTTELRTQTIFHLFWKLNIPSHWTMVLPTDRFHQMLGSLSSTLMKGALISPSVSACLFKSSKAFTLRAAALEKKHVIQARGSSGGATWGLLTPTSRNQLLLYFFWISSVSSTLDFVFIFAS